MRIVHAIRSDGFAGVESHVARLAVGQARAGHRVAVIGGDPTFMRRAMAGEQILHRPAATVLDVVCGIDALRRSDILHVHMTAAEIAAVAAVRTWTHPVVSTRHFAGRRGSTRLGALAVPLISHRIQSQIAISSFVAEAVDGPSTVVYPGLPPDSAGTEANRRNTVLVVQRLEAEKRTRDAIELFARSGLADRGWRLTVVGEGAQRAHLQEVSQELGVESVTTFLGHRGDVKDLMRTAGLLVAPCDIEGFGLTVLEAMSVGLPVLACGAGAHLETVGVVPGAALYPPGDLAKGASMLQRLGTDPQRRAAYGAELCAVQRTRFTVEAQVKATESVYLRVLDQHRGRRASM